MRPLYYVRSHFRDGAVILSHPFADRTRAERWAFTLQRSRATVRRTFVIVRQVQPIGEPMPAA